MISGPIRSVTIFFVLSILIDQISKWFAPTYFDVVLNRGISFGFFSSSMLSGGIFIVMLMVLVIYGKKFFQISPVMTGIFFGAAGSNLIDRVQFGGVRDFMVVPILGVKNNLSDWMIFVSLLSLLWQYNRGKQRR